jgi:hypothetical protein
MIRRKSHLVTQFENLRVGQRFGGVSRARLEFRSTSQDALERWAVERHEGTALIVGWGGNVAGHRRIRYGEY